MLIYNSLLYKPLTTLEDAETGKDVKALDLLAQSVRTYGDEDMDWGALFTGMRPLVVRKEYVARPDLVSLAVYKTDEYTDLICKLNGISNPFELNEDMVLMLPDIDKLKSMVRMNASACEKIEKEENDNIAAAETGNKKLLNEKRSPNEATVRDSNFIISKDTGLVFY